MGTLVPEGPHSVHVRCVLYCTNVTLPLARSAPRRCGAPPNRVDPTSNNPEDDQPPNANLPINWRDRSIKMSFGERLRLQVQEQARDQRAGGPLNAALLCPHCGQAGHVHESPTKVKTGISGSKATAALLTGGLTLLTPGIGLSRKARAMARACGNCGSKWTVVT